MDKKPKRRIKKKKKVMSQRARPSVPADASCSSLCLFCHKEEVARRIGVTARTVGVWAQQEKLPAYRFGRFLRFKWSEVEAALAAGFRAKEGGREKLKC